MTNTKSTDKNKIIYADNAATTPMSDTALKALFECSKNIWGNPSSSHSAGQRAAYALTGARQKIAAAIGADFHEIFFTSGGTEANNQAILSAAKIGEESGRREIITSSIEHPSVLKAVKRLEGHGFKAIYLKPEPNGIISPVSVENAIGENTCLVSIMAANNETGTVQKINEIGVICQKNGVLFHTDAVQAAGHIPLDVKKINADFLSISAHKFHGPKGAGALFCKKGIEPYSLLVGGEQERGKRAGTQAVPLFVSAAAALEEAAANIAQNAKKTAQVRDRLLKQLLEIRGVTLNGDLKNRLPGNINITVSGVGGEELALFLDGAGICVSTGSACASGSANPSHVLLSLGLSKQQAKSSLRITLSEQNTADEADFIAAAVKSGIETIKKTEEDFK